MTISSGAARPYSVFIEVPRFYNGLFAFKGSETFVDKGANPSQLDGYSANESRIKTILACLADSMFLWIFPAAFAMISVISSVMSYDLARLAWELGLLAAWIITVIVAHRYINRQQKSYDETTKRLAGDLAPVPKGRERDLHRIQNALQTLQQDHGPAYDEQAQEAVSAVLVQDRHRPCEKHLIIADSTAVDPDSVAIRARALASKAAWGADVARAEHLILVLEATAEQKVPATV